MRKLILAMMLAVMSGVWMTSEAVCLAAPESVTGPHITVQGLVRLASYPCDENEDCPDCMTGILTTGDGKIYYLTTTNQEAEELLDYLLYSIANFEKCVIVTGTPYTRGEYSYLLVDSCEHNCVGAEQKSMGLFGNWVVLSGGDDKLQSITFFRDSDYRYGYTGSAFCNKGEYGELLYTITGDNIHFTRFCAFLDEFGYEDHCSLTFSTSYSIEEDLLTLHTFAYEQGEFMTDLKLIRNDSPLLNAKVLLSGKWQLTEENKEENGGIWTYPMSPVERDFSYNFWPNYDNKAGICSLYENGVLKDLLDWSLTLENDATMSLTISSQHMKVHRLTINDLNLIFSEETEAGKMYRHQHFTHSPAYIQQGDTIPLYAQDDSGSSTIEPIDPNQIVATLDDDKLTIRESSGDEITYNLERREANDERKEVRGERKAEGVQSDTFHNSVTIQLTEDGVYQLELTNPSWDYIITGTFRYGPQGTENIQTSDVNIQKILRDGRLYIQVGGRIYGITGQQIQ